MSQVGRMAGSVNS